MAEIEQLKQKANICDICTVCCSSALQLCEHVVGQKHRANAKRLSPGSLTHLNRLQYFFDTYMKQKPLLGLEYIEEQQRTGRYHYKCQLCGFRGDRKLAFLHITGVDHMTKYVNTHHPKLSLPPVRYAQKYEHVKELQQVAADVCATYGRKKIQEVEGDEGPTSPKTAKGSSEPKTTTTTDLNGYVHTRSLRYLERRADEHRGFKDNGDFLDYLQKFEIRNDEDAAAIKQITQNCTQALVRFREEQARQTPPTEVPAGAASDNAMSFGGTEKVDPAPLSAPPTDATQLFFSSIKTMEESEVVGILEKIATTNPAFRGINVPNVVKYLQATGRLKTT